MSLPEQYLTAFAHGGDTPTRDRARVVANNLPRWLLDAPATVRKALIASQARSQHARGALTEWLAPLPRLDEFAEQHLKAALKPTLGDIDVRNHVLAWHKDVGSLSVPRKHMSRQTLLQAALQNFVADEVFGRESSLLPDYALTIEEGGLQFRYNPDRVLAMTPATFAATCRSLDIGGQYQRQLTQHFNPVDDNARVTALFADNDRYSLEVQAHIAYLRGHIGKAAYQALLATAMGEAASWGGKAVRVAALQMMHSSTFEGGDLHGPLLVDTVDGGPCVLYLPLEPDYPLKEYPSLQAAHDALREKLRQDSYRRYWMRFVSHGSAASFADHLKDRLTPLVTTFPAKPRREPAADANLNLARVELAGPLFAAVHGRRVARILDDGKVLAMPTADIDQQQRDERNRTWLAAGLELLGVVALFIPGVGELMLFCAAVQVVAEIYTGVQDWRHGDADAAASHALDVAENVTLLAAMYGVGKLVQPPKVPAWPRGEALDELVPVCLPDGRERLLRPTLAGYEATTPLPNGAPLNDELLLEHDDQEFAPIGDRYYAVRRDHEVQGDSQVWRVTHPTQPNAYEPLVEVDGASWRLKPDQAITLKGRTLRAMLDAPLERLGSDEAGLALRCAGVDATLLDSTFYRGSKACALLTDTLARFDIVQAIAQHRRQAAISNATLAYKIASVFEAEATATDDAALFKVLYDDSHFGSGPEVKVLIRDYPSLPTAVAEELLAKASPRAKLQIVADQRLPLEIAEQAREAQQALRLNRALEGLCHGELATADTARLKQQWQATLTKPGTPAPGDEQIRDAALADRTQCALALNQRPPAAFFNAPVRDEMGRWGYAMSGRRPPKKPADGLPPNPSQGQMIRRVRDVYPSLTPTQALDYLRRIHVFGQRYDDAIAILAAHEAEYQMLQLSLEHWIASEPSAAVLQRVNGSLEELRHQRQDVSSRLLNAWRRSGPEDYPQEGFGLSLDLSGLSLLELPPLLHGYNFVHALDLSRSHLSVEGLSSILLNFRQLRSLDLTDTGLQTLPSLWFQQGSLRHLELGGNHLLVDQEMFDQLGQLRELRTLSLNGNTLLGISAANGFPQVRRLGLAHSAMGGWPAWLASMPRLAEVDLRNAGLTQLPDSVLSDEPSARRMFVDLRQNVLPARVQERIAQMRGPLRAYTLLSAPLAATGDFEALAGPWMVGLTAAEEARNRRYWFSLRGLRTGERFMWVMNRLRGTSEFTLDPAGVARRVRAVVRQAAQYTHLRRRMFGVVRVGQFDEDAVLMTFADLEMLVFSDQPAEPGLTALGGALLLSRLRSMFRVQQIGLYSDRLVVGDLELPGAWHRQSTLNLQLRWVLGGRLNLPARPLRGPLPGTALLTEAQLNAAQLAVQTEENGEAFIRYLLGHGEWRAHLERTHGDVIRDALAPYVAVGNWAQRDIVVGLVYQQLTRQEVGHPATPLTLPEPVAPVYQQALAMFPAGSNDSAHGG